MKLIVFAIVPILRRSPPSRGAWIEINFTPHVGDVVTVAPLAGGGD